MKNKILVVDDEENIRSLVKDTLENSGFLVETAINGDECLKILKNKKFDLILMDIMMPGMPVKDVIDKIDGVKIAHLSVVGISEEEKAQLKRSKKVVAYIKKPFSVNELVKKVNGILGE